MGEQRDERLTRLESLMLKRQEEEIGLQRKSMLEQGMGSHYRA